MKNAKRMLILVLLAATSLSADEPKSGLQPGDKTFAFHVQDVTGPRKGKQLCYACAFGKHRVVNIQTKRLSDELVAVIKQLDSMVNNPATIKGDSKHAFVVYLTEDLDEAEIELTAIAKKQELENIPLTIYDELSGPKPYKLSKEAEVTVMMWSDNQVKFNHAFASAKLDKEAIQGILRDAKSLLAK